MTANISHVLKQLERQNTTMLLWKRVTELANQTETIKIVEANTTQIFNHTKSKSKLTSFSKSAVFDPFTPLRDTEHDKPFPVSINNIST